MENIIESLEILVESVIDKEMAMFNQLGKRAKMLSNENEELCGQYDQQIHELHVEMADIVKGLGLLESIAINLNPHLEELFGILKSPKFNKNA